MTSRKFYVYPLLFSLILFLASPRLVAAADLRVLVHALEGRLAQLGQGTIQYNYYSFKCPRAHFRKIRDAFDRKDVGVSIGTRNNRLRALLYGPSIHRVTAYQATMYYEAQGKRWRLVKKNIKGYGLSVKDLKHLAAVKFPKLKPGEKVHVTMTVEEDVSYDGKTLLCLENNKTLTKSGLALGLHYPTIMSLDISLGPWYLALENAPLANQTITVTSQGSIWSISYMDKMIAGRVSDEASEFDAAKGFAPVRIYGTDNKRKKTETLFHCHRARGNKYIVDSVLSYSNPAKHGKISGEVYLIKSWSNKVTKQDLKVKLPKKYTLIDERQSETNPIFKIIGGNSSKQKR